MESTGESVVKDWKKPLELFHEKEIVRICAPMVRYSKSVPDTKRFSILSLECLWQLISGLFNSVNYSI